MRANSCTLFATIGAVFVYRAGVGVLRLDSSAQQNAIHPLSFLAAIHLCQWIKERLR